MAVDSTAVPLDVEAASYELALTLATDDATIQEQAAGVQTLKRSSVKQKVDVIETQTDTEFFNSNSALGSAANNRWPLRVQELIGLWTSISQATTLTVLSGGGVTSSFTDCDTDFGFVGRSGLP